MTSGRRPSLNPLVWFFNALEALGELLTPVDPAGVARAELQRQALVDAEAEQEVHEPSSAAQPPAVGDRPAEVAPPVTSAGLPTSELLFAAADVMQRHRLESSAPLVREMRTRAALLADIEPRK